MSAAGVVYVGIRTPHGAGVHVQLGAPGSAVRPLPLRLDLRSHSPTGFEWGYLGSGPAQLALAICADALEDDRRAVRVYQDFKALVVAAFRGTDFRIAHADVIAVVEGIEDRARVEGR